MRDLLRFWFTYDGRVDRRTYFVHGFALAVVKFLVDAALIWTFADVLWTPLDYLAAGASVERSKLGDAPAFLHTSLALWTLPFVWIGHSMSFRRAVTAGITPWLSLLFFLPLLNYVFMAGLCAAPAAPRAEHELPPGADNRRRSELKAIAIGALTGFGLVGVGVLALNTYGASLFFGAPFAQGAITAYLLNRWYTASRKETRNAVFTAVLATGFAILMVALEGAVCVLMAFPLALVVALMGGIMGRRIARSGLSSPREAFLAILLVPAASPLVDSPRLPLLREVRSAIEIDAPGDVVWKHVVSFPRLDEPTDWVFRSGISYPVGARIDGTGVGATRYCEFSTGDFVEPVTRWEPGVRLSFDVTQQPRPMRELSPYDIAPPHLDGYFTARRGEFRLAPLENGGTRLEGSTWYELRISPEPYWALFADALVSRIHQRVLRHIKAVAELPSAGAAAAH